MPDLAVELLDPDQRLTPVRFEFLARHLHAAAVLLGVLGEVRVKIVGDEEMAAAHLEYLDTPGTTDVLTFDLSEPPPDPPPGQSPDPSPSVELDAAGKPRVLKTRRIDTDILICADVAQRVSGPKGFPVERELLLYAVHGVLHCLGFDDHDEAAAGLMHRVEDAVLTALDVGTVFRDSQ